MYPSEYAYQENSVYGTERDSANCRNYPRSGLPGVSTEDYIHCDGTPLRLTDSDLGSQQFTVTDYYTWLVDETRSHQLLFIFPTRINLNTITLHYYRTSGRGLPRLRFYAVPDDFDIRDAPTSSFYHVDVVAMPPGRESAGQSNVCFNVTTVTMKLLMIKFRSSFSFAVSEVEFFNHTCK